MFRSLQHGGNLVADDIRRLVIATDDQSAALVDDSIQHLAGNGVGLAGPRRAVDNTQGATRTVEDRLLLAPGQAAR